ncbi:hypothetical protein ABTY20_32295 [Streptomyces sp. NPDC126497]|uniref:hypothetical protein n=1 Tax=Streptomyces sp. NPDC126497 TaxID=3155313 RepID=UPI00332E3ADB
MTASRPLTAAEESRGAGPRVTAARVALLDTVRQDGPARGEGRDGHDHHPPVCRSSGAADRAVGGAPCPTASDARGSTTDEAEVVRRGPHPGCSTSRTT